MDIDIRELNKYLGLVPIMAKMNPLSLAFLPRPNPFIFSSSKKILEILDDGQLVLDNHHPYYLTLDWQPELESRFLAVKVNHNPLTPELNNVLSEQWDWICSVLVKQSNISDYIFENFIGFDCCILVLVDGLSWHDFIGNWKSDIVNQAQPIIVDGISKTDLGMTRILGNPPLVERLPIDNAYGFSYWDRTNPLTDILFSGFGSRVEKIKSFDNVLGQIQNLNLEKTYIQIVRQGLDEICHRHRDRPSPENYVHELRKDFENLINLVIEKKQSAQIFLTSDHGILWQNNTDFEYINIGNKNYHPRYINFHRASPKVQMFSEISFASEPLSHVLMGALKYPYIVRNLKSNEWGVHGGISFEESIVPLLKYEIF